MINKINHRNNKIELKCVDKDGALLLQKDVVYEQVGETYVIGSIRRVNINIEGVLQKGYYYRRFEVVPTYNNKLLYID